MSEMTANECSIGDRFNTRGKDWTHCGYAPGHHVAALADDGERKIIPSSETVYRISEGSEADADEACKRHGIPRQTF